MCGGPSRKSSGMAFWFPIFFVTAGIHFDLDALWTSPLAPLQIMILPALLVLVRGIPSFVHRRSPSPADLVSPERATAVDSSGMVSVPAFPILAGRLRMRLGLSA